MDWQTGHKVCPLDNQITLRGRGLYIPSECISAPITDTNYFAIEDAYGTCPSFPDTTDGVAAVFNPELPPLRMPLDHSAWGTWKGYLQGPAVSTNCSVLNNTTWCPTPGGCQWQEFTVGQSADDVWHGRKEGDCSGLGVRYDTNSSYYCLSTMSLCMRTRADPVFKHACCTRQWPLGVSHSIDVSLSIALDPTVPILHVPMQGTATLGPSVTAMNAFSMACDPAWCVGSSQCDPDLYEECIWSTTTLSGNVVHATLAPDGVCSDWYKTYTQLGLLSQNSWVLIDDMINSYCLASATTLGDTTSCACVNPQPGSILYSSCTDFNAVCDTIGDNGLRRVAAVNVGSSDTIALSDYVCSNPACLAARQGTSFITSGLLARVATCPTQVCMQMIFDETISIGEITGGSIYIRDTELYCSDSITSPDAPIFALYPANAVWFYDSIAKTITNPDSIQFVAFTNFSSQTENYTITYSPLPSWVVAQTVHYGSIQKQGQFNFGILPIALPASSAIAFTLTALTGGDPFVPPAQWTCNVAFSLVDVSIPQPPAPEPSKPGQTDGILPRYLSNVSTTGKALLVMSVTFILFSIFLMLVTLR